MNYRKKITVASFLLGLLTSSTWAISADFNDDGRADILERTGSSNHILYMNADGTYKKVDIGKKSTKYSLVGTGDFNGDGIDDLFWRVGNSNTLWLMNKDGSHQWKYIGKKSTKYKIAGLGDFNNDGVTDIFWRRGNSNTLWLMNDDGSHQWKYIGRKSTKYKIVGLGDFNDDGVTDIFWRRGNSNTLWLMSDDGSHKWRYIGKKSTQYRVAGLADFNDDGIVDILWRKGSGTYLWYMNEGGTHKYKNVGINRASLESIADYNGDGVADILWKSTNHLIWMMNDRGVFTKFSDKNLLPVDNSEYIKKAKKEPYFKYAWHIDSSNNILNNEGLTIDTHADINVTEAWKSSMGKDVIVAVIDDGAEVEHEDLKENVLLAYNADNGSNKVNPNSDEGSHGNTCAGFIVAPINGKGIVGVAPKAKMIIIRQESSVDSDVIRAFEYAKKSGAKVISCSWGTNDVSDILVSELKKMYDAGITVLFASGNEGTSLDGSINGYEINDESEVKWVIGVGASGENNDVTTYSNYGKNIDVIACGGDTELSSGVLGLDDMGERGHDKQRDLVNNNYSFTDGTSFATPITAGVVALMYGVNPNITPKQVREILIKSADKVGIEVDASYDKNGFDMRRAYGKVNAGKAVEMAKKLR